MPLFSLSPVLRGEGRGEGTNVSTCEQRHVAAGCPLTLTLSPEYDSTELVEVRGEGSKCHLRLGARHRLAVTVGGSW